MLQISLSVWRQHADITVLQELNEKKGLAYMECKQAISWMHDYLDHELPKQEGLELQEHLRSCEDCRIRFGELERTEMLLFGTRDSLPPVSDALTEQILKVMPQQKQQRTWVRWIKRHPALTAAALFLAVIVSSGLNSWGQGDQLIVRVKGDNPENVIIQGHKVIVPEGTSIAGNLTVENGEAEVYGEVQGNLTVIDGSYFKASTAHISGEIKSIDQALDWVWYKVSDIFTEVAYR